MSPKPKHEVSWLTDVDIGHPDNELQGKYRPPSDKGLVIPNFR